MELRRRPRHARVRRIPPPAPTIEQIDQIIDAANADPHLHLTGDVIGILSESGLRCVELCRLRKLDIDVASSHLFVSSEMRVGRRSIPLTPRALNTLQCLNSHFPDSAFVMGDRAVAVLHRVSLQYRVLSARLGIVSNGLHSLRRSCAMRLAYAGMEPIALARFMGFSQPRLPVRCNLRYGAE